MERFLASCPRHLLQIHSRYVKVIANFTKHQAVCNSFKETDERKDIKTGPSLGHFIANSPKSISSLRKSQVTNDVPYLKNSDLDGQGRKGIVHFELGTIINLLLL